MYIDSVVLLCMQEQIAGSLIMTIQATDKDHGRNAELTYLLLEENDWDSFAIDGPSGNLTNTKRLNRESKASYEVSGKEMRDRAPDKVREMNFQSTLLVLFVHQILCLTTC